MATIVEEGGIPYTPTTELGADDASGAYQEAPQKNAREAMAVSPSVPGVKPAEATEHHDSMWQRSPLRPSPSLRERFSELVEQWTRDGMFSSSSDDIRTHPAYQQVIGLGPQAIPLIYEHMLTGELHWSWALSAITGEDHAADTDSPRAATAAWIRWIEDRQLASPSPAIL